MAEPVRRNQPPGVPVYDPTAVERRYAAQRARRHARSRRVRARRYARVRFFVVLLLLLALAVYVALALRHELERLFGL